MKLFGGRRHRTDEELEREERLAAAEKEVRALGKRADRVKSLLEDRLADNHWGEAVRAIARREH